MSAAAGFGADFARGQRWAEPSVVDLQRIMRQLAGGHEVEEEPDAVRSDSRRNKSTAERHVNRVTVAPTAADALYASALAHAAADPIEAAELQARETM